MSSPHPTLSRFRAAGAFDARAAALLCGTAALIFFGAGAGMLEGHAIYPSWRNLAEFTEFAAYHAGQGNDAYVESLYQAGLGRPADASGLASWSTLLSNGGATRADVLLGVATSDEARAHLTYNLSGAPNS